MKRRGPESPDRLVPEKPARRGDRRLLRLASDIQRALGAMLARDEVADPAIRGDRLALTGVRVSPGLYHARVYVQPLYGPAGGDAEETRQAIRALNAKAPRFRHLLGLEFRWRRVPELSFHPDTRIDEADRVLERIRDFSADGLDGSPTDEIPTDGSPVGPTP